ncbi:helix-turn-helix domain-containing protein [Ralstonia pseudosolanacearum]|uniref:helix-turn-helix domain-containing protein n=1 Tax=Ralstonia pseudosolanacearum TaxID=1310165 RepID=UPI003CEFFDCE
MIVEGAFGERLEEERQRLGLGKGEMARAGAVSAAAYTNYLKGERTPDLTALQAWAKAGVDPLYIAIGQRIPALLSPEEELILGGYRKLDARGRAGVLGLISGMQPQQSKPPRAGNVFHGKVGNIIEGDYHQEKPLTINMGGGKKKRAKSAE